MKKLLLVTSLLAIATTSFAAQNGKIIQELAASGDTIVTVPVTVEARVIDGTKKRLELTFDNGLSPDGTALRFILGDVTTGSSSKAATSTFTARVVSDASGTLATGAKVYGGLKKGGAAVSTTATSDKLGAGNATLVYNISGIETTSASAANSATGAISVQLTNSGTQAGTITDASVSLELTVTGANNS